LEEHVEVEGGVDGAEVVVAVELGAGVAGEGDAAGVVDGLRDEWAGGACLGGEG
jgi:hypothetical protein